MMLSVTLFHLLVRNQPYVHRIYLETYKAQWWLKYNRKDFPVIQSLPYSWNKKHSESADGHEYIVRNITSYFHKHQMVILTQLIITLWIMLLTDLLTYWETDK